MTTRTPTTRYVHTPLGGNLSQRDAAGAWHWALVDGLGSVRGMVDEAFTVEGSRGFAHPSLTVDGCRPQSSADAPAPAEGGSS